MTMLVSEAWDRVVAEVAVETHEVVGQYDGRGAGGIVLTLPLETFIMSGDSTNE